MIMNRILELLTLKVRSEKLRSKRLGGKGPKIIDYFSDLSLIDESIFSNNRLLPITTNYRNMVKFDTI